MQSVRSSGPRRQSKIQREAAPRFEAKPRTPRAQSAPQINPEAPSQSQAEALGNQDRPFSYVWILFLCIGLAMVGIWRANQAFAPEMYSEKGPQAFADAFVNKLNFATFDLNINIREMRDKHIQKMSETPEVVVLGASHWQEAHTELLPGFKFYNAHVHRDYYEDMLGVVEMFVRHDRLPKKMIIAIRDRLFTPVSARTDFLWLPGIPYYEAMARRIGLEPHSRWETLPVQRWRELISVSMLFTNVSRWYKAPVKPYATPVDHHKTLDTLRPGGSIYWSKEHQEFFTQQRSHKLALEFAKANFASPPKIDPVGVQTLDRLFAYLKEKGVELYFVHPPFNPIYFDAVRASPYRDGLRKIEAITQDYAQKYGAKVFGSFDPADVGCTSKMYIDAEHSNPACLGKLLKQFADMVKPREERLSERFAVREFEPEPEPAEILEFDAPEVPVAALAPVMPTAGKAATDDAIQVGAGATQVPSVAQAAAQQPPLPVSYQRDLPPLPTPSPRIADATCVAPGVRIGTIEELRKSKGFGRGLTRVKRGEFAKRVQ